MLNQIDRGMTFGGQNLTLAAYLRVWISVKKNALRLKSGFQYERLITLYIVPVLGKMKLKDLNLRWSISSMSGYEIKALAFPISDTLIVYYMPHWNKP